MKKTTMIIKKRYAAMTEYIIILALVAVGSIAIFQMFGGQIRSVVGNAAREMEGNDTQQLDDSYDRSSAEGAMDKSMSDF